MRFTNKQLLTIKNGYNEHRASVFSLESNPSADSQMCSLWSVKNPPDILEGTKQLKAIEAEFEIIITEDEAVEMYDLNLREASEYIQKIIALQ
jgi:hypothetical protein